MSHGLALPTLLPAASAAAVAFLPLNLNQNRNPSKILRTVVALFLRSGINPVHVGLGLGLLTGIILSKLLPAWKHSNFMQNTI